MACLGLDKLSERRSRAYKSFGKSNLPSNETKLETLVGEYKKMAKILKDESSLTFNFYSKKTQKNFVGL